MSLEKLIGQKNRKLLERESIEKEAYYCHDIDSIIKLNYNLSVNKYLKVNKQINETVVKVVDINGEEV